MKKLKDLIIDKRLYIQYFKFITSVSSIVSVLFPFSNLIEWKSNYVILYYSILFFILLIILIKTSRKKQANFIINKTPVNVLEGNILEIKDNELNVIAFNEYFDTIVDDKIISKSSLHGQVIQKLEKQDKNAIKELNLQIENDEYLKKHVKSENKKRTIGKKIAYELGSSIEYKNYVFTTMTDFDEENRGHISKEENSNKQYIRFCLNFWENIDRLYNGRTVNIPILGAGITRFGGNKPSKQELLKILLWTLKLSGFSSTVSEVKINFFIYEKEMHEIDFFDLQNSLTFEDEVK